MSGICFTSPSAISVGDSIPNSWVMFTWDIYQPLTWRLGLLTCARWERLSSETEKGVSPLLRSNKAGRRIDPPTSQWLNLGLSSCHHGVCLHCSVGGQNDRWISCSAGRCPEISDIMACGYRGQQQLHFLPV